jgi:hypothetical protein
MSHIYQLNIQESNVQHTWSEGWIDSSDKHASLKGSKQNKWELWYIGQHQSQHITTLEPRLTE